MRVTATNYEDAERNIEVNANTAPIHFMLNENNQDVVVHKEERTRTKVNIRNSGYSKIGVEGITADLNSNMLLVGPKFDYDYVRHFGGLFALRYEIRCIFPFSNL